jgi:hypothetical protein
MARHGFVPRHACLVRSLAAFRAAPQTCYGGRGGNSAGFLAPSPWPWAVRNLPSTGWIRVSWTIVFVPISATEWRQHVASGVSPRSGGNVMGKPRRATPLRTSWLFDPTHRGRTPGRPPPSGSLYHTNPWTQCWLACADVFHHEYRPAD